MEYFRGLRILRADPEWLSKLGVGSLLLLSALFIPFLGQVALQGWTALILRRAVAGQESPLPRLPLDLHYLGKLLNPGFKAFIASFIWSLPVGFLLFGVGVCFYLAVFAALGAGAVVSSVVTDASGAAVARIILPCGMLVFGVLIALIALVAALPAQVATIRAELSDDLNQGLRFREVMQMTRVVFRELLWVTVVLAIVQFLVILGSIPLCGLPALPAVVALMAARANVGAQLYKLYLERGGAPIPSGPLDVGEPAAGSSATF